MTSETKFVNQNAEMGAKDQTERFSERLDALGRWLRENRLFWTERPFVGLPVAWEAEAPEISAALRALTPAAIETYESRPWELPEMPTRWCSLAKEASVHSSRMRFSRAQVVELPKRPRGVSARKWEQICAFISSIALARIQSCNPRIQVERWLDWCSGKGHLGRTLATVTSLPVTCVERDKALCRSGESLAVTANVPAQFVSVDVLLGGLSNEFRPACGESVGAVALHACGELHRELLRVADAEGATMIALAPCCYHRYSCEKYTPLSAAGSRSDPRLGVKHLRLIGLNEAVASVRCQSLRRREQAFRLGLDLLLREVSGKDQYRPLGPVCRKWIDEPFEVFCRLLATRHGLYLPDKGWDSESYERWGWERYRLVRALGMARGLFRRPLEMWLQLDLAQYLAERCWKVVHGTFCDEATTLRNGLILAWR